MPTRSIQSLLHDKLRKASGSRFPTYRRTGTEATFRLEQQFVDLERGFTCRLFPSGMAALAFAIGSCTSAGGNVLYLQPAFSRLRVLERTLGERWRVEISTAAHCLDRAISAFKPNTQAIVFENPDYLMTSVIDIGILVSEAKRRGISVIVDNTWSAGVLSHPLLHGADMSVLACSKHIGSPSGVLAGAIISNESSAQALNDLHYAFGQTIVDSEAEAILSGLNSIESRLHQHSAACDVVLSEIKSAKIDAVHVFEPSIFPVEYRRIFDSYFAGRNGTFCLSFAPEVSEQQIMSFVNSLKLFSIGGPWGARASSVRYIESAYPDDEAVRTGPVLRFSVGLDGDRVLAQDLLAALSAIGLGPGSR